MNNKKNASANQLTAVPRHGAKQGNNTLVCNHYTTGVNSSDTPETKARHLLREAGFSYLQQLDWVGKKDGKWVNFEIKEKFLFESPPYQGTGLGKPQLFLRTQLLQAKGERTYLLTYDKATDAVYGGWLDELEAKNEFFDTRNGIRIYPIANFSKGVEAIRRDLNG